MADENGMETASSSFSESGNAPMIGGYRLIRQLGAGGMGVVYEAEQQQPKRLVALKVIQGARLLDELTVKQFEREAQALARLKHPGIAAIYESGRTPDGQHFFAMELVRGDTLEVYLKKSAETGPLTPAVLRERLAIFRKISDAITYAHQRGVIHRDLKPSNIIIHREFDSGDSASESRVPGIKILDFGLARITETDLAAVTSGTEIGKIQGTLPYMSPEQVRGNSDEIDVRSDVYSLGVILYEMIAGRRPYNVHHAMWHEAARVICEVRPEPLAKTWTGTKRLDKDIETIVGKALEKDAPHRYQSVAAFGEDVARFLTGQPILARPPNAMYQLRKMAARHKVGFGFAAAIAALIVIFAVVMSIQAERIARERDRANREAKISKQVSGFMRDLFRAPDPFMGKGKEVTAREILDEGSARIASELKDQPEVRMELALLMGESYHRLGVQDKALDLAQNALEIGRKRHGDESAATANALNVLGAIWLEKGDLVNSEKYFQDSLKIRRKIFGPDSIEAAENINDIAMVNHEKGDYKKAEEGMRESLVLYRKAPGDNRKEIAVLLGNLAIVLKDREKLSEAAPLFEEALAIKRRIHGDIHPAVASAMNNLAMLHMRVKNFSEAEKLFQDALAIDIRTLGELHREVSRIQNNLGLLYLSTGQLEKSADYFRQSIRVDSKLLGENNPDMGGPYQNLGSVLARMKKFPEAEEMLRKGLSLHRLRFASDHWAIATTQSLLGDCLLNQRKYREAEPLLARSYEIIRKQFGPKHDRTRVAAARLIALYDATGRKDKSAAIEAELANAM
ncbi:MAG: serine/threonine protein kinase [Acidobacteria bacterium]|nr:serine/threonine protein kinase [Acidobacteriota bacterium]